MECYTVTEVITTEMEQKCIPPVSLQKKDYIDGVIVLGFLEDRYLRVVIQKAITLDRIMESIR